MQRRASSLVPSPGGTDVHLSQGIRMLRMFIGKERTKSLFFECGVENCTIDTKIGLKGTARTEKRGSSGQLGLWVVSSTA